MATEWEATFAFRIGAAFPAEDRMARYVMRLSSALGDLRIALRYATRARQNNSERLYFDRLSASNLREIVSLLDPPDHTVLPTVEQFVLSLPRGTRPTRAEIRASHMGFHALAGRLTACAEAVAFKATQSVLAG